jgi:methylthioribose-1-phosphate isomerase
MIVNGKHYKTVWMEGSKVFLINQNKLPFEFEIFTSSTYGESIQAIKTMITRGAGAIGVTAGFAVVQAAMEAPSNDFQAFMTRAISAINASRPTANNLFYATKKIADAIKGLDKEWAVKASSELAQQLALENILEAKAIGEYGNSLIKNGMSIETHCNAGWLGFVDYGSALSPIYTAHREGKKMFIYVDETRPRGQGARLTAWELQNEGIPHAIIADNAGAFYMQRGEIDMMIVGADRIAANGDVANKIGTLEKAIIAKEYNVPFYVAAPTSTIDINCPSGKEIPIEMRSEDEVLVQSGLDQDGNMKSIHVAAPGSPAYNPAFDVSPAKYISGIITEKGIVRACEDDIRTLFD